MPSSSSSSSSSSFSSCSSSSSSSYHNFITSQTSVEEYGKFEIINQTGNTFLINTGIAYDGYGNRLVAKERVLVAVDFPASLPTSGGKEYGYLCVRRKQAYKLIDYMDDPATCLPHKAKYDTEIEFYAVSGVLGVKIGTSEAYYPPVDSNGVLEGLVLGQVFKYGLAAPNMLIRSPLLAVKDGTYMGLTGFNLG